MVTTPTAAVIGIAFDGSVDMTSTADGWAVGVLHAPSDPSAALSYRLLHTTDGGAHWRDVTPRGYRTIVPTAGHHPGWVVAQGTAGPDVLFTPSGGASWQRRSQAPGELSAFSPSRLTPPSLEFTSPSTGWLLASGASVQVGTGWGSAPASTGELFRTKEMV